MPKKNTDVSGSDSPEGTAADAAQPAEQSAATQAHEASGKKPIWSRTINRVSASIWAHERDGKTSYSTSINRTYLDRRNNQWKRVSSYDRPDLKDVRTLTTEAEAQILHLEGMVQTAGEE